MHVLDPLIIFYHTIYKILNILDINRRLHKVNLRINPKILLRLTKKKGKNRTILVYKSQIVLLQVMIEFVFQHVYNMYLFHYS